MINRLKEFCRSNVNTNVHNILGAKVVKGVTNAVKAQVLKARGIFRQILLFLKKWEEKTKKIQKEIHVLGKSLLRTKRRLFRELYILFFQVYYFSSVSKMACVMMSVFFIVPGIIQTIESKGYLSMSLFIRTHEPRAFSQKQ